MSHCPEIDLITSATGREHANAHLAHCEACQAVASLAAMRSERRDGRDDACAEAEVGIGLWHAGVLDAAGQAELVEHLESCASCSETAVRLRALGRFDDEVAAELGAPAMPGWERREPRSRIGLALAAAAALVLAFGAGALVRGRGSSSPTPAAVELVPAGAPRAPLVAPVPCVVPADNAPLVEEHAVPTSKAAPRSSRPERRGGDVIDPWSVKPLPAPAPSGTPRPSGRETAELRDPWAASSGEGYLTVVCEPFCDKVRVSGKDLGPSPIVNSPLSAGVHAIVLERGSVKRALSVEIKAGESRRLRVRMTEREAADPGY